MNKKLKCRVSTPIDVMACYWESRREESDRSWGRRDGAEAVTKIVVPETSPKGCIGVPQKVAGKASRLRKSFEPRCRGAKETGQMCWCMAYVRLEEPWS